MLYWICPECGQECSPAIRECPTCTAPPASPSAASGPASANGGLLSLAQNFPPAPLSLDLASAPPSRKTLLATNGHEPSTGGAVATLENVATLEDEPTVEIVAPAEKQEEPPPLSKNLAMLDPVLFQPSCAVRIAPVKPVAAAVPPRAPAPQVPLHVAPARASAALPLGKPIPGAEIRMEPASGEECFAAPETAEPLPSRRRSVAFVRPELPLADSSHIAHSGLAPLPRLLAQSVAGPAGHICAPSAYGPGIPASVPSGLAPGESLSALLRGLEIEAQEADRQGVQAIESSFAEQPGTLLLSAPAEIVQAPAPPCEQWMGTAKPRFTAVEPESGGRAALIGPRAPTLAGPTLPPQLLNFGQQPAGFRALRKRMPLWPFAMVGVLLLALLGVVRYYGQDRGGTPISAALPAPIKKILSTPRFRVDEEHPAARSVEVAGIRILTPPRRKPQVQFVVINHSASEITGLDIHLAVSSADAATDAPLFTVSSIVSSLGPEQSREIRVDVNSPLQPSDIPDWQSLRTQVLIGRE